MKQEAKEASMRNREEKERYDPRQQEPYWQQFWSENRFFKFNPTYPGPLFTIDTPPPTISGRLHLGHAFSYSQAEAIAAWLRMRGYNVRYPFGLDNNGLPTERLAERETGINPFQSGVTEFRQACLSIISDYTPLYEKFFRRLGFRWDLDLEYSTISPEIQRLSQEVFLELYKRELIYRKKSPVLYCPECKTSVAQAEVEDKEQEGTFYDLVFRRKDDKEEILIATTRPELLPACVAVFVHPKDERYQHLIGQTVVTPLGKEVKVIADEKVSPQKGTGIVMCCTYGDRTDVYWKETYNLPEITILDEQGNFTNETALPSAMRGKSLEKGKAIIIELLKKERLIRAERPITHDVGVHERCGKPIEIIPTPQWFVKILEMKPQLLAAAEKINWYPPFMKKRYLDWINGLNWDWCISRGRFFGIPIPVFYCQECQATILPHKEELPIDPQLDRKKRNCPHCGSKNIKGERAVLDTWFTSALTPDINNNHPLNGPLTGKMYPMSMRPNGHDIIRTWVTYSILMGLFLHGSPPWKDLMISGHILAKKGEKISKKTGGGIYDPMELTETYSADALRYVLLGGSLGQDVYFDEKELQKGQRLVTKIYNAGRFVLLNLQDFDPKIEINEESLEAIDRWILFRAQETAGNMNEELERYEFGKAKQIFEDFFWKDFCDNYLEIIKGRVYGKDKTRRLSAQYALYHTYLAILKMVAPFLPHISEEMYHSYCETSPGGLKIKSGKLNGYFFQNEGLPSIHLCTWPFLKEPMIQITNELKEGASTAVLLVEKIRQIRSKSSREKPFSLLVVCDPQKQKCLEPFLTDIKNFSGSEIILVSSLPRGNLAHETAVIHLN